MSFSADGSARSTWSTASRRRARTRTCTTATVRRTHKNGFASNQYNPQLIKAGLQSFPLPAPAQLATLTAQVATNNRFVSHRERERRRGHGRRSAQGVKHVIFIIKENRTYDQVLGDAGDRATATRPWPSSARRSRPTCTTWRETFVTLDNFYATAEVSYDGWPWTTSAQRPRRRRAAGAGHLRRARPQPRRDGTNRSVNVALPTLAERQAANPLTPDDPDLLPGQVDVGGAGRTGQRA